MIEKFLRDPQANTLAVVVLVALLFSAISSLVLTLREAPIRTTKGWYTGMLVVFTLLCVPAALDLVQTKGLTFFLAIVVCVVLILNIVIPILLLSGNTSHPLVKDWYTWAIPVLIIGGLAVAGYLTFIEATAAQPVCGPLGNCADVQNSKYAILFGVLPIGMLGLAGYAAIIVAWLVEQFGPQSLKKLSVLAVWGMSLFGVIFSSYLTFLEPFVIGATCMWCITSAVLMILLLWISTPAAQAALAISDDED
jgi:uncharacterized membrane protein